MPKLLSARPPQDKTEEQRVRQLAASRHAPGDWIQRARMIVRSWEGRRTALIAVELRCHPQTVRERLARFNTEGLAGLGDRPGAGRKPRVTEAQRSALIALVATVPPGRLTRHEDGSLVVATPEGEAHWTLDALVRAARDAGIPIARSQVRRILLAEKVRWRQPRSWATSTDPEFAPKGRPSSSSTRRRRRTPRSSASTSSAR
jgi:transposase